MFISVCHPGEVRNCDSDECELCPMGTYTPVSDVINFEHKECIPCPEGQTTASEGSHGGGNCIPGNI